MYVLYIGIWSPVPVWECSEKALIERRYNLNFFLINYQYLAKRKLYMWQWVPRSSINCRRRGGGLNHQVIHCDSHHCLITTSLFFLSLYAFSESCNRQERETVIQWAGLAKHTHAHIS